MQTNLTQNEAEQLTLAIIQLIHERDLEAAISVLETSIDFSKTESIGLRALMFKSLFDVAFVKLA